MNNNIQLNEIQFQRNFNSIGSHITTYCILFNRLCCAGLKLAAAADAAVVVGWTFNIWGLFAYGISELTT